METHVEPKLRTIKLRVALTVGAAAVAGALGVGYVLAQVLDAPAQATVSRPCRLTPYAERRHGRIAGAQTAQVRGKAADVRYRRVITP